MKILLLFRKWPMSMVLVFQILARCGYNGNGCGAQEKGIKVPLENNFRDMTFRLGYDPFECTKASKAPSISVNVISTSLSIKYLEYIDYDSSSVFSLDVFHPDDSLVEFLGLYDNLPLIIVVFPIV